MKNHMSGIRYFKFFNLIYLWYNSVFFFFLSGLNNKIGTSGRKMSNINSSQIPNPGINNSNTATLTRPRPQPITGTPPPDQTEKFDQKIIQTCNLFGLNLVNIPNNLNLN